MSTTADQSREPSRQLKCRAPDFAKRGVKVIGISANGLEEHRKWAKDIEEWGAQFAPTSVGFPIVSALASAEKQYERFTSPRLPMQTARSRPSMTCLTSRMPRTVTRRACRSLCVQS